MSVVVVLPAFLCALFAKWKSPERALIYVLVPTLLLLPAYYTHKFPGVPVASFHNYALLTIAAMFALNREWPKFSAIDIIVFLYIATAVVSELEMRNAKEAQNLAALMIMTVVAPFWIGRVCGTKQSRIIPLIGMLALVGAIIGWISPYEARMGSNPFDFWRKIWPKSVPWDGALYRGGLRRVAGPFAHPICNGFFFSMVLPLALWLFTQRMPEKRRDRWFLLGGLVGGLLSSLSRGPIMGAMMACGIAIVAWSRKRIALIAGGCSLALFAAPFVLGAVEQYMAVDRSTATTESQETAAYRKEMLSRYVEVVAEEPMLGYGRYQIPVVAGLKSIDNQYLFLALTHGMPHAVLFLACILGTIFWLAIRLVRLDPEDPMGRLGWALVGTLTGSILTQATVFAGTQTAQLLFVLLGLAIGIGQGLDARQRSATRLEIGEAAVR